MQISALYHYPVKSMRGIALNSVGVEPAGLDEDRRWMVVDERGRFLTRREAPALAQIEVRVKGTDVVLAHAIHGEIAVSRPFTPLAGVTIWGEDMALPLADPAACAFLSRVLGRLVRLVYQPAGAMRSVDPAYGLPGDETSLTDGFPILITTEESLAALNERLPEAVEMQRFRPNIVLCGAGAPWAEDSWRRIRIGGLTLRIVKPCSRCIIITQDPLTGEQRDGNEPIATLRKMGRMGAGGIYFGQNAIADRSAEIRVGDAAEVLEVGESNFPSR